MPEEPNPEPSNPADPPPPADPPSPSSDPPAALPGDSTDPPSPAAGAPGDGGGTLAEGGGADDEPTPQSPATWPDNWREILAGGDAKFATRLNRFASPVNFGKSWLASQQKITGGEMLRAKPEGDVNDPAHVTALNEWRAQAGVPAEANGYLEKLPDGLIVGEEDKPLVDSFLTDMHAADAPPDLVHKALGWYYANEERLLTERAEEDNTHRATAEDELRAEWGPEYKPHLNGVWALLDEYGAEGLKELYFSARLADGTPLGDHPDTLRFLSTLSREINPHGTVTPAAGQTAMQTIQTEKNQLTALMADQHSKYWRGPEAEGMQARWRELDEMEQRHKGRA